MSNQITIKNFNLGGMADSKFFGVENSNAALVGFDLHKTPGVLEVCQELTNDSGTAIDDFVLKQIQCSNGDIYAFGSTTGKVWKRIGDNSWNLVYTMSALSGGIGILDAAEYEGYLYMATQNYLHRIPIIGLADWETNMEENWQELHLDQEELGYTGSTYIPQMSIIEERSKLRLDLAYFVSGNKPIQKKLQYDLITSHKLTFYPHTSLISAVAVNINKVGTGNWTLTIHDANHNVIATKTISGGNLTTGYNTFSFDTPVDIKKDKEYHIHITSTIADGGVETFQNMFLEFGNVKIYTVSDADWHPMVVQNGVLYIGDRNFVHQIEKNTATDEHDFSFWALDIEDRFRVKCLGKYKTNLVLGTYINNVKYCEPIIWNTWSVSFSANPPIHEAGINAIIYADKLLIVNAGDQGRFYVFDGEDFIPLKTIPGEYSPTQTAITHPNAWSYFNNLITFGMSNILGTAVKAALYCFGGRDAAYPDVLSINYPISQRESNYIPIQKNLTYCMVPEVASKIVKSMEYKLDLDSDFSMDKIEIGSILVSGNYMYVSWKDKTRGVEYGIDRIDYTQKLSGAYLETRVMKTGDYNFDNFKSYIANYVNLPENTDILMFYRKNYSEDWIPFSDNERKNDKEHMQVRADLSIPARPFELKIQVLAKNNEAPVVEEIIVTIE